MFVFNVKLNLKSIIKVMFVIMAIIVILAFLYSTYRIIKNSMKVKDEIKRPNITYIDANNYTNILKCCYENIDDYLGTTICFSGYVYRSIDFDENQFVLARDMLTSNSNQTLIVGFLCEYSKAKKYADNEWVEIIAEIKKGNYHGEIPILKIKEIKRISKPESPIVPPPDDTYIQTSVLF